MNAIPKPLLFASKEGAAATKADRLGSLDAYRGFIMLAMVSGGLGFAQVARQFPKSEHWQQLAYQFDHVAWAGCGFWDLIQPSFMFMVGVAIPYSVASRLNRGDSYGTILRHAIIRSLLLIFLGIFLIGNWSKHAASPYWAERVDLTFVNVLTQIGLGYVFVFLLHGRGWRVQLAALTAILVGYWLFFYVYTPPENVNLKDVGLNEKWQLYTGLFAHWNKNLNAASWFDSWLMNLFPRKQPWPHNSGGYQTLNFIPSMATMILGLMAGELLRGDRRPWVKFARLVLAGTVCLGVGWALGETVCPLVKRIWTPSWAVFSAGWTFLMLAFFYGAIDLTGWRRWALPLAVVGMNSIAIYCMAQLLKPWVRSTLQIHFGREVFQGTYFGQTLFSPVYAPIAESVAFVFVLWLACVWMYRQKIFVRI